MLHARGLVTGKKNNGALFDGKVFCQLIGGKMRCEEENEKKIKMFIFKHTGVFT